MIFRNDVREVLAHVLPTLPRRRGRPWNDHRVTLEARCWQFRTDSPWRDIPDECGPGSRSGNDTSAVADVRDYVVERFGETAGC